MTHIPGIAIPFDPPGPWVKCERITCVRCNGPSVQYRMHGSTDGAFEDSQFRCDTCGHSWWVDGIDS